MKSTISVIIPTFNGKGLLETYLQKTITILEQSESIDDFEVIIVDDASSDDTASYLQSLNHPKVSFLSNEQNSGFSKTINRGIQNARMNLSLLLNNDMEISSDFFDIAIPYFSNKNLFGINCEIRDISGTKVTEGAKIPAFKHGMIHYKDLCEKSVDGYTLYLCGGNALVSTEKLKELGAFNELFSPFYFEDFDLSLRAWRQGWECLYTSKTFCKHCHSITINRENKKEYVETIFLRNKLLLNYLHGLFSPSSPKNILKKILFTMVPSRSHKKYLNSLKEFKKIKGIADQQKKGKPYRSSLIESLSTYFDF